MIEYTAPEAASGFYGSGFQTASVIGLDAEHYIVVRHRDAVSVQVTGSDAKELARVWSEIRTMKDAGVIFASYLHHKVFSPALEAEGFIGVGLIDTLQRPLTGSDATHDRQTA